MSQVRAFGNVSCSQHQAPAELIYIGTGELRGMYRDVHMHRVCPVPGGGLPPGTPHHSVGTHQQDRANQTRLDERNIPEKIAEMAEERAKGGEGPSVGA